MKTDVYNLENVKTGEVDLPETIFGEKWREALVVQVLDAQLSNKRKPWAHAKTRAEVRGGGRKPWKQKGTGRARHGSTRSPIWVGGGKAHGPLSSRDYSKKVNKKMKQVALFSVLSKKFKEENLKIFESFEIQAPKTKILSKILKNILEMDKNRKKYDVLLIRDAEAKSISRAVSNLSKAKVINSNSLNLYDILNHKNIFISKNAVKEIGQHYK